MVVHGPDDPMCCPTERKLVVYVLEGDNLIEESSTPLPTGDTDPALLIITWEWQGSLYNNDTNSTPEEPNRYSIQFMDDGTISIKADCNMVLGTYSLNGNQITIETGISTLAACPPDSLDSEFLRDLTAASLYFFDGDQLYIDLKFDTGTMQFSPAE
jgi:heat shock protein HslJ